MFQAPLRGSGSSQRKSFSNKGVTRQDGIKDSVCLPFPSLTGHPDSLRRWPLEGAHVNFLSVSGLQTADKPYDLQTNIKFSFTTRMKIFEVIFLGSHGDENAEDTIYLVRATDFRSAVDDVQRTASARHHKGKKAPLAHVVHELGTDLSKHAESNPQIIRGPYFAHAYNYGWRAWHRKTEGPDDATDWTEESQQVPQDSFEP
jgi:hypothetical protein